VTRLQNVVSSFRLASDPDVVTAAAAAWADLADDHDTIRKMALTLDDDLPLIRSARAEVSSGPDGLPHDAANARTEVADLLAAGDFLTHRGQIKELTAKVANARAQATSAAEQALIAKLESLRAGVRERFTGMDAAKIDEALRPVDELQPPGSADISFTDLRARIEVADARCAHASRVLEELQAAGNLARVHVSQIVTEPITSEDELDVALGRVRQVALVELADGKQVRLQ
jgi:hypothetical protein